MFIILGRRSWRRVVGQRRGTRRDITQVDPQSLDLGTDKGQGKKKKQRDCSFLLLLNGVPRASRRSLNLCLTQEKFWLKSLWGLGNVRIFHSQLILSASCIIHGFQLGFFGLYTYFKQDFTKVEFMEMVLSELGKAFTSIGHYLQCINQPIEGSLTFSVGLSLSCITSSTLKSDLIRPSPASTVRTDDFLFRSGRLPGCVISLSYCLCDDEFKSLIADLTWSHSLSLGF